MPLIAVNNIQNFGAFLELDSHGPYELQNILQSISIYVPW